MPVKKVAVVKKTVKPVEQAAEKKVAPKATGLSVDMYSFSM